MALDITLASGSPRRAELLEQLGVTFEVMPADIDETPLGDELPEHYVLRLARVKAQACLARVAARGGASRPVLAADTVVSIDGLLLGKPADNAEAAAMLRRMAGRWHMVHTAVAVAQGARMACAVSSTRVEVALLDEAAIAAYVASGEPCGKAGGYGIQGRAGAFVRHIEGSYSGVMGLPLYETATLLREFDIGVLNRV